MPKRIYVGNLPFNSDEAQLKRLFGKYGAITAVRVPTGRSGGQGYVEFQDAKAAAAAMKGLDGVSFGGRNLQIVDRDTG